MMNSKVLLLLSLFVLIRGLNASGAKADIGVILDLESSIIGKICKTSISMAIHDFYSKHRNYSTMIVPHFRDSGNDVVTAAAAAIDLLKNTQVMAIVGPERSIQANFVMDISDKVKIPMISPASSPAKESPYFIRSPWFSSSQAKAIAAIVNAFGWRKVVFVCEDSTYLNELLPMLTEHLLENSAIVSSSTTDDQILLQLYKLKTMQTRVFVVGMGPALASRFFRMAKEAEMMGKGYAWITTDVLTSLLDRDTVEAMQGVVSVKAHFRKSDEIVNFIRRWSRRFHRENPGMNNTGQLVNVYALWAYDSITALAEAIELVGETSPRFKKPVSRQNLTDLEAIGVSDTGPLLAPLIGDCISKGLSGEFLVGRSQLSAFEIVNVIGRGRERRVGFWTEKHGLSRELIMSDDDSYSTSKGNFGTILWPGEAVVVPKGWEYPTSGSTLRVGLVGKTGPSEFIKVERHTETNAVIASGFCIDVFQEAMSLMPYAVQFEYIPFETVDGYHHLIQQIPLQRFDAVVGDVTITINRSHYVDFTIPYMDSAITTIVPIKDNVRRSAWIFMKPLTTGLWLTIIAFFFFTGCVVWVLERRINNEFRGSPLQQVGMIFWFSFSTLVFAHRERVMSNLTRIVVIVWVFVVLVLTSSYTASLTSMLTVQQLQPTNIYHLLNKGEYVGCPSGSLVREVLRGMKPNNVNFDDSQLRSYSSAEEFDEALTRGSKNGGVAAIVGEMPYIRLFLSKYCHKYTMTGPTYSTSGFGFAFRKGSPLVSDVSTAIMKLKEGRTMTMIMQKWFGEEQDCSGNGSEGLNLDNFKGLFLFTGISFSSALVIYLFMFLYKSRRILASTTSIKQKLCALGRAFAQEKDDVPLPP